jgi:hypothetical protein
MTFYSGFYLKIRYNFFFKIILQRFFVNSACLKHQMSRSCKNVPMIPLHFLLLLLSQDRHLVLK